MPATLRWLGRRLILAAFVVFGAATAAFAAMNLMPGDPVLTILGSTNPTPALIAQVRSDLGYDEPFAVRYAEFLGRLVHGDLGQSYQLREPVTEVITGQLLPTAELALTAFVLALAVAAVLAVTTAGRRPAVRRVVSALELLTTSSPGFWIGILLLTFLSFRIHLFPAAGGDGVNGLVLPAITLALGMTGVFSQVLRAGLERALEEPYALTARARGTGETAVRTRHALRHALIPVLTLSGWALGTLLSGAVVVETVFGRRGIGRVMATAVIGRDVPTVTGVVIVSAVFFTLINILVDGLYRVIDPRLRQEKA
ncbi:ABC transporter permease [Actinocorallia sp. API 0066]|uniref:ABC transporter permease n=1 Tax=Actinocorallia sp. API 0066 TaxID=2896846 RepID=UPI001E598DFE|nr:ABC transporter permease [Actinocorallia sp. API 0066]MCD0451739.1 ABC transporter permease [Actinocorallia sp. API 0066]